MDESEARDIINAIQLYNQQLQAVMIQKQTLLVQNREIESALEELDKNPEEVYKTVGPILVKSTKDDVVKELEESKEDFELKIKTLESQEKKITEKLKESQEKFREFMPAGKGG